MQASTKDVKFKDKQLGDLKPGCVMIVGQNPGRQRQSEQTYTVWESNRSSDLLAWVLEGVDNVYLTNVVNYQEITPERTQEGRKELEGKIRDIRPRKIVCLGSFSHLAVASLELNVPIRKLMHPSFIARFNKDREEYKRKVLEAINE